jgi:DNA-binding NtrC family response regulator/pSer/pThr/pTyr-binding forkhead associated (FHA) protein
MPALDIYRGNQFITRQALAEGGCQVIGRGQNCEVVLPDPQRRVSRQHAVLVGLGDDRLQMLVRDLGSLYGTRLNGSLIAQHVLGEQDIIEVADYKLVFTQKDHPSSASSRLRVGRRSPQQKPGDSSSTLTQRLPKASPASRLSAEQMELMEEAQHRFDRGESLPAFASEIMPAVVRVLSAEKGFVGLFTAHASATYREVGTVNFGVAEEIEISDPDFFSHLLSGSAVQEGSCLLVPMGGEGGASGFFCVCGRTDGRSFSAEDVSFLHALGKLAPASPAAPHAGESLQSSVGIRPWPEVMIGQSTVMKQLQQEIQRVASTDLNVLVLGESGSGKELVARALHQLSANARGPLIARNCGQTTDTLAEAEIFGYTPQSGIAGANPKGSPGWFQLANGGTLFLDEVHRLSPAMQDQFLRVLQDKNVWPIGAREPVQVNVRVVAATDEDLDRAMEQGHFRSPFRYRFGATLRVPPLRARSEDLPLLAFYFLDKYAGESGSRTRSISHRALRKLASYDWPGNVRRLEQMLQLGVARGREVLFSWDFEVPLPPSGPEPSVTAAPEDNFLASLRSLSAMRTMEEVEREYVKEVLEVAQGNVTKAAQLLGYGSRQTLLNKMDRFGIPRNYADVLAPNPQ